MAEQFKGTLSAERVGLNISKQMAQARTGAAVRPGAILEDMTTDIFEQVHALVRTGGELGKFAITPNALERGSIAHLLLRENLGLAIEAAGGDTERVRELRALGRRAGAASVLRLHPDLLEEIYTATGGFDLIRQAGRLADFRNIPGGITGAGYIDFEKVMRSPAQMRGLRQYYGLEPGEKTGDGAGALQDNTEVVRALTETIQNVGGDRVPTPVGVVE